MLSPHSHSFEEVIAELAAASHGPGGGVAFIGAVLMRRPLLEMLEQHKVVRRTFVHNG